MMLRTALIGALLLAGCARFEPRLSVETTPPRGSKSVAPAAVPKPVTRTLQDQYIVVRGDTLYGIAFRHKLDFRDLAAWNNVAVPYTIHPGQTLRLAPASRSSRIALAPASTQAAARTATTTTVSPPLATAANAPPRVTTQTRPSASAPSSNIAPTAVEASADTQTFAVSDDAPPVATPLSVSTVGQVSATTNQPAPPPAATLAPIVTALEPAADAPIPVAVDPAPPPVIAAALPEVGPRPIVDPAAPTREREGLRWRWPHAGGVIGRFVDGDPTQQGIDIGGGLGQVVLAASAGEVVYSGNGLLGYGELVIVQHSPGFLSAYGHNQRRLVAEGVKVQAGQPIAEMGRRGGIDMLHFEIRRNGKPVDPLAYLPQR